ncbi:hypothetical protein ACRAWD_06520 [Caulobacter segnis]
MVEAWFPGTACATRGQYRPRCLDRRGEVDRPWPPAFVGFSRSVADLPRPADGVGKARASCSMSTMRSKAVGYKWYDLKNIELLLPFGHGLSYTQFAYLNRYGQRGRRQGRWSASTSRTSAPRRQGRAASLRAEGRWLGSLAGLAGFKKVSLASALTSRVTLSVDPRSRPSGTRRPTAGRSRPASTDIAPPSSRA